MIHWYFMNDCSCNRLGYQICLSTSLHHILRVLPGCYDLLCWHYCLTECTSAESTNLFSGPYYCIHVLFTLIQLWSVPEKWDPWPQPHYDQIHVIIGVHCSVMWSFCHASASFKVSQYINKINDIGLKNSVLYLKYFNVLKQKILKCISEGLSLWKWWWPWTFRGWLPQLNTYPVKQALHPIQSQHLWNTHGTLWTFRWRVQQMFRFIITLVHDLLSAYIVLSSTAFKPSRRQLGEDQGR